MTDFSPYVAFSTSVLKNGMHSLTELENITRFHVDDLNFQDPFKVLMAFSGVESDFGKRCGARFELGYSKSSLAYRRSESLREGHSIWEDFAACSYGPHQIMWIVARELGYPISSNPADLISAVVSLPYVVEKLNELLSKGVSSLEDLAASYNAGIGCLKDKGLTKSGRYPHDYVKKFFLNYNSLN